ncbi:hypothetical protein BCR36DRAFT_458068 [Piromyces finnis]|uniref:Uncharacterized protein n=1 Tax=Piromyces finnis TaxID=1754191 RepID=A0A1Y1V151_9FUNG|nr:hypothetical protein BCR36DRAFT_458068 [Piromyces finnis]|eukprot:ORX44998.1 hypothetical protein BCR36DRAFT_458068 [Piromyces finnis]
MSDEALRQQNKILTLQRVTVISDEDNDVETWYEQMQAWKDLHNIEDKKEIYEWCLLTVRGSGAKEIRRCITYGTSGKIYPYLETARDILKNLYDLEYKQEDIIDDLKELKIGNKEDTKDFNKKYKNKYNQLESFDQNIITVADYLNAIESRPKSWKGVKLAGRKIKLNEAFEIAELYDKVDKKMKSKSTGKSSFSSSSRVNNAGNSIFQKKVNI